MIRVGTGLLVGWTLAATMLNIIFAVKYWNASNPSSIDRYLAIPFYLVVGSILTWMSTQPEGWTMMISVIWALVNSILSYSEYLISK